MKQFLSLSQFFIVDFWYEKKLDIFNLVESSRPEEKQSITGGGSWTVNMEEEETGQTSFVKETKLPFFVDKVALKYLKINLNH